MHGLSLDQQQQENMERPTGAFRRALSARRAVAQGAAFIRSSSRFASLLDRAAFCATAESVGTKGVPPLTPRLRRVEQRAGLEKEGQGTSIDERSGESADQAAYPVGVSSTALKSLRCLTLPPRLIASANADHQPFLRYHYSNVL